MNFNKVRKIVPDIHQMLDTLVMGIMLGLILTLGVLTITTITQFSTKNDKPTQVAILEDIPVLSVTIEPGESMGKSRPAWIGNKTQTTADNVIVETEHRTLTFSLNNTTFYTASDKKSKATIVKRGESLDKIDWTSSTAKLNLTDTDIRHVNAQYKRLHNKQLLVEQSSAY